MIDYERKRLNQQSISVKSPHSVLQLQGQPQLMMPITQESEQNDRKSTRQSQNGGITGGVTSPPELLTPKVQAIKIEPLDSKREAELSSDLKNVASRNNLSKTS